MVVLGFNYGSRLRYSGATSGIKATRSILAATGLFLLAILHNLPAIAQDTLPVRYDIDTSFHFPNAGFSNFGIWPTGTKGRLLYATFRTDSTHYKHPDNAVYEAAGMFYYTPGRSQDDGFTRIDALKGISHKKHFVGFPSLTTEGKTLFYAVCRRHASGNLISQIYQATLDERGRATKTEQMDEQINMPQTSSTQPCVVQGADGHLQGLFFASDRRGGKGGMDLYYAPYQVSTQTFDQPQPLYGDINTTGNEGFPFYNSATRTLYFSSDGHTGLGGMDVFATQLEEGKDLPIASFLQVSNLGAPINSLADDISFCLEEPSATAGYVSSNREGATKRNYTHCCEGIFRWQKGTVPAPKSALPK